MPLSYPPLVARLPRGIVPLLATAVFINYVDRGNLATASPLIEDELRLSNSEMGILLSAFFWSYTPLQLVAGWLSQRFDVRYVYAGGLAVWSLATALTGLVTGFATLLTLRALVGIGESVTFPCNAKLLADYTPEHERGRANGLVAVGIGLGPAFGTLVGGLVMANYGWRIGFLIFGIASILWLWPWLTTSRGIPVGASYGKPRPITYCAILRQRAAWGTSLGHFCSNYGLYFVLSWLPLYLVKARGFTIAQMAVIGGLLYCVYAAAAALTGWVSDRWIASGASVNVVRKRVIMTGLLGAAACMPLCTRTPPTVSVLLLGATAAFLGLVSPQLFCIAQTLGGPRAAGRWMGLQNSIGNLSGVAAPLVSGCVIDQSGDYLWAFIVAGLVLIMGVLAWGAVLPHVAPVLWPDEFNSLKRPE